MAAAHHTPYFVTAATVAAELHKAMYVARRISLISSNARALAQRAGHRAAGFRALTGFIDELANKTVQSSNQINALAIATSRAAIDSVNGHNTLQRFDRAFTLANDADHLHSLDHAYKAIDKKVEAIHNNFRTCVNKLTDALEELARELRSATVLAAMSRIEAIAAGLDYQQSLEVIADDVAHAANQIQDHVKTSQSLFAYIQ